MLGRHYTTAEENLAKIKKELLKEIGFDLEKYLFAIMENKTIYEMNAELERLMHEFECKNGISIEDWFKLKAIKKACEKIRREFQG